MKTQPTIVQDNEPETFEPLSAAAQRVLSRLAEAHLRETPKPAPVRSGERRS
jgi:hypothetical protein